MKSLSFVASLSLLGAFAAGCSHAPADGTEASEDALSASAARALSAFVSANATEVLSAAKSSVYNLRSVESASASCVGRGRAGTLAGVCLVSGRLTAPRGETAMRPVTLAVTIEQTKIGTQYAIREITHAGLRADDPTDGTVETYLVDGGGEDSVYAQLEAAGYEVDEVIGSRNYQCVEAPGDTAVGACFVEVKLANGRRKPVSVTVAEYDSGPSQVLSTYVIDDAISDADAASLRELQAGIAGLMSGGGEADPVPYALATVSDPGGAGAPSGEWLAARFVPRMGIHAGDMTPGFSGEETDLASFWSSATEAPNRADFDSDEEFAQAEEAARKWAALKTLVEAKLTDVKSIDLGNAFEEGGSIETGQVANTLVGRLPSGRVVALYGIVVWT
jgi:hypothetical protein